MSESRVRENRMHGSMRRREAPQRSRHCRASLAASRRPYATGLALVAHPAVLPTALRMDLATVGVHPEQSCSQAKARACEASLA
jgi:hypothetical protein